MASYKKVMLRVISIKTYFKLGRILNVFYFVKLVIVSSLPVHTKLVRLVLYLLIVKQLWVVCVFR
jgi:hypothetical protein